MIVVTVELWSAITGQKRQLARMHIANDGAASSANVRRGDYAGVTFKGRDEEALARGVPQRRGKLVNWPRLDKHVWNMVAAMLLSMGYGA